MDDQFDPNHTSDDSPNDPTVQTDNDDLDDFPADDHLPLTDDSDDDDTVPPARKDEEWKEGLERDDDIDEMAEELTGEPYADTEEINITKKYKPTSLIEPPEDETLI